MHNNFQEIQKQYEYLQKVWVDYWTEEVVFTYQWWFMILVLLFSYLLWWRLVDKSRLIEVSLVGFSVAGIALVLDQVGASLGFWTYPYTLTPLERDLWAVADFSIISFFYSMIYQWFPKWKSYIIAHVVFAFFAAFVGEIIFQRLGIYVLLKWEHVYSIPFYILLGIGIKLMLEKIKLLETNSKKTGSK